MDDWQPIETAPKDGEIVDLWHRVYGRITDTWWDDGGWVPAADWQSDITHWKPLPEPPGKAA